MQKNEFKCSYICFLHHNRVTWKLGNIYKVKDTRYIQRTPKESEYQPRWEYVQGQKKGTMGMEICTGVEQKMEIEKKEV